MLVCRCGWVDVGVLVLVICCGWVDIGGLLWMS